MIQKQDQNHECRDRGDIEPAERVDHPELGALEQAIRLAGRGESERQKQSHDQARPPEHLRVHLRRQLHSIRQPSLSVVRTVRPD